ncbi:MAG: zinc-dependent alcohol dehydrogenase, partial [Armatimonadota bacterium]
ADGCLCEQVVCLGEFTFPLPEGISLDEGAMTEPLAVGIESAAAAQMHGGEICVVLGAGAIGLSALQALRAGGAGRIVVSEPIPERRGLAENLGADAVAPPDRVKDAVPIGGADVAVEASGSPEAPQQAVELVRPGGTVVLVGIPENDMIVLRASTARRKALTVRFVRRYRHRFRQALEMMADGRAKVSPYVTHLFSAKDTALAFELTASRSGGVVRAVVRFAP